MIIRHLFSVQMPLHVFARKLKKQNINLSSDNAEVYNRPFSMEELHDALRRAHDTFHLARWLEWCGREQASFCQASRGRLAAPPTGGAGRLELSCVVPASVVHIWPIHISWGKIIHLSVSAIGVFWQFTTFWWSAIKNGKLYLVEEMWWNHLDSTPH